MMSQSGRKRDTILAVLTDFVTVTIAAAFKSWAVVHVAWLMALAIFLLLAVSSSILSDFSIRPGKTAFYLNLFL